MIDIIIGLLMSLGIFSTDFTVTNLGGTPPDGPDGLGSTANGTCIVKFKNGDTYILSCDEKGNYTLTEM